MLVCKFLKSELSSDFKKNVLVQGITNQKIRIKASTLIYFNITDPYKVYTFNLDIELDRLLGSDILEHYSCVIDFNKKQLTTNFKTIPLFEATEDTLTASLSSIARYTETILVGKEI